MGAVFERFTDQARRAVVLAAEEARGFGHNYIGTEHILLGVMGSEGTGSRLLQSFAVSFGEMEDRILQIIGRGPGSPSEHLPFTPRAKKVLELSLREAIELGDRSIGTEHILLGLLREGEGIGAQVLADRNVSRAAVRAGLREVEREPSPEPGEPREPGAGPEASAGGETIEVPAEHFARLMAEVARLRDLLRRHGIDPGEELPELGPDGDPPVA